MLDATEDRDGVSSSRSGWLGRWTTRTLSVAALAVAGYLLSVSLEKQKLPVGCGAGSGCAEVLASRWSSLLGIPVSGLAAAVYLAVLIATFFTGEERPAGVRRAAWALLIVAAAIVAGAGVWFVGLQIWVIDALCPWCLADHALGTLLAISIAVRAPIGAPRSAQTPIAEGVAGSAARIITPRRALGSVCAGIAAVSVLALTQWLSDAPAGRIVRLPPGVNADSGPGPDRRVAVIDGKFQVAAHELPVLGSADSPKLLLVLFDYCCPHCRAAHGYLVHALPGFEGELGVLLCPMPMDHKCNRTVKVAEPRFEHACELARLALAVWRSDQAAFAAYDAWLFEPESPRDPATARQKAEAAVGAAALEAALRDPWIDRQIALDVEAYAASGADRIPVLMSPGISSIVGRPESEQQLLETLRTELRLGKHAEPAADR